MRSTYYYCIVCIMLDYKVCGMIPSCISQHCANWAINILSTCLEILWVFMGFCQEFRLTFGWGCTSPFRINMQFGDCLGLTAPAQRIVSASLDWQSLQTIKLYSPQSSVYMGLPLKPIWKLPLVQNVCMILYLRDLLSSMVSTHLLRCTLGPFS